MGRQVARMWMHNPSGLPEWQQVFAAMVEAAEPHANRNQWEFQLMRDLVFDLSKLSYLFLMEPLNKWADDSVSLLEMPLVEAEVRRAVDEMTSSTVVLDPKDPPSDGQHQETVIMPVPERTARICGSRSATESWMVDDHPADLRPIRVKPVGAPQVRDLAGAEGITADRNETPLLRIPFVVVDLDGACRLLAPHPGVGPVGKTIDAVRLTLPDVSIVGVMSQDYAGGLSDDEMRTLQELHADQDIRLVVSSAPTHRLEQSLMERYGREPLVTLVFAGPLPRRRKGPRSMRTPGRIQVMFLNDGQLTLRPLVRAPAPDAAWRDWAGHAASKANDQGQEQAAAGLGAQIEVDATPVGADPRSHDPLQDREPDPPAQRRHTVVPEAPADPLPVRRRQPHQSLSDIFNDMAAEMAAIERNKNR